MQTKLPFSGALAAKALLLAILVYPAIGVAQTSAPLIQQSDIKYLGSFGIDWGSGTSTMQYGGAGIAPYKDPTSGKMTLFMQGHSQKDGQVAQIEVPATLSKSTDWGSLPKAKYLQNFYDVTDGRMSSAGDAYNGMPIFGMLAYNGRLIVAVSQSYGSTQVATHGASGLNLATGGDFKGFYSWSASAPLRAIGGSMTPIPQEWRTAFGGAALTGNCCLSVISATSAGPAATVFNPDDVGAKTPIPGTTVLNYPISSPLCGSTNCEATQNNSFNLTTRVQGIAFPRGSRSVLFFGTHGTGPYCYGTQLECNDQFTDGKGPHAPPYRSQIWAYDANDLIAVKSGSKSPSQPRPYAMWAFGANEMYSGSNSPYIKSAGYDPESGRLYIAQNFADQPTVYVYEIKLSGVAPALVPSPPSAVKTQ